MFGLKLFCLQAAATTVHPNNFEETQIRRRPSLMGGRQYHSSCCRPPSYARVVRGGRVQAKAHMRVSSCRVHSHLTLHDPMSRADTAGRTMQEGHHPRDHASTAGRVVESLSQQPRCNIRTRILANRIDPIATHETQRHNSGDQKPALQSRNAIRKIDHFENSRSFAHDDNTRGNSGRIYFADEHIYNSCLSGVENVFGERGSKTSDTSAATYAADRHSSYSVSSPLAVSLIRPPASIGNPLDWTETMRPPSRILTQGPVSARWRQNG